MAKFTPSQISEAITAIETKSALEQIEHRYDGGEIPNYTSRGGPRYIHPAATKKQSPLYDSRGQLFAGSFAGQGQLGVQIPSDTPVGTIIAYRNKDQELRYAVVSHKTKGQRPKGMHVKALTKKDVDQLTSKDPEKSILLIDQDDLIKINPHSGLLFQIFDTIDPTETIFFKLLAKSLMGNVLESESVGEMFFILYFRLMLIAASIISITYIAMRYLS